MKTKEILVWILAMAVLLGAAWKLSSKPAKPTETSAVAEGSVEPMDSVPTGPVEGKQVVEITVKEGYQPAEITVKAGQPVILKMKTSGTFDCSTTFSLTQFKFRTTLSATGDAAFEIPAQKAGESVYGVCGMGMYHFVIKFT